MIRIKKGLDLPLYGLPEQKVHKANDISRVALVGLDYNGMKPTMEVKVGDRVKKGQVVFTCKKREGVKYTAPGAGVVVAIERGEKRIFENLVIQLDEREESVPFEPIPDLTSAPREEVEKRLIDSGLWTAIRTRPYGLCPLPGSSPQDIFVPAMDTNPLAANQEVIIRRDIQGFHHGLKALTSLTKGKVYVCTHDNSSLTSPAERVKIVSFLGPHPAGNVGTHMHFLSPVSENKTNWFLDAQDVMAMGRLLLSGELNTDRIVSLAGPMVKSPRLLQARLGTDMDELTKDQLKKRGEEARIISGSVLHGRKRTDRFPYLGRFARQVTVIREERKREFLGWHSPGLHKFSIKPIYLSFLNKSKKFYFTTTTNGSLRAMVPIGMYEKVMPLDILPTQLLRSLCAGDTETAQKLGALELDEEDLALCTFVDPGKVDYGSILRENLTRIEREG
ncbi:MAG: Na(+)-translocating NADH-quinone reductase subunit A [Bacteriovoracales bacterium]|nr:Na(+)-translocating NADH-quinone reductase subunit A [Bacteriovoracales bacterium]